MPDDLSSTPIILPPGEPDKIAKIFLTHQDAHLLLHEEKWFEFKTNCYREIEFATLFQQIWKFQSEAWTLTPHGGTKPFCPTPKSVNDTILALKAIRHIPANQQIPFWIGPGGFSLRSFIFFENGILDLDTGTFLKPTPEIFVKHVLDFAYDPDAVAATFIKVLEEIIPDPDARSLFQEVLGYLISRKTNLQRFFLFVGPTRSGKGTLADIITRLVGLAYTSSPSLNNCGYQFFSERLPDKRLAIVRDNVMSTRSDMARIRELLLQVTGEDQISIDKKYKDALEIKLETRLVMMSNEVPKIPDPAGSLRARCILLETPNSFVGEEDRELATKLAREVSGIFNFALEGYQRLMERGDFDVPMSVQKRLHELWCSQNLTEAFFDKSFELDQTSAIAKDVIFAKYAADCTSRYLQPCDQTYFFRQLYKWGQGKISSVRPSSGDGTHRQRYCRGVRMLNPVK